MENILFDQIRISKIHNFKVNKGKYCFVNYPNKLIVDISGTIAFDVDYSYNRPNIFININKDTLDFVNDVKTSLVKNVHMSVKDIFGTYKTIETLTDCYCNPHKITQVNTVYTDLLKMKINCEGESLLKGTKVNLSVHISGMWFSESSYGPYFNVIGIDVINVPKKEFIFLDDSDDESSYVKVS